MAMCPYCHNDKPMVAPVCHNCNHATPLLFQLGFSLFVTVLTVGLFVGGLALLAAMF